ncbi:MAG: hypothetical protein QOE99_1504 [Actinomycetota bacterium]|jgi:hypothetical protein|nr:hypothetical protein [Actinomycetota bacterium]
MGPRGFDVHPDEDSFNTLTESRARLLRADEGLAERDQQARESGPQAELDEVAATRDMISSEWDDLARRHDTWAQSRDLNALDRDKVASDRDVTARRLAGDGDTGFPNRWHSAADRDDSGGDRSDSFDDRRHSAEARERAATDREQATNDRKAAAGDAADLQVELRQLREAIITRGLIGQAIGLLMARDGLSTDHAFALLTRQSQVQNLKLRELAASIVAKAQPEATVKN